MLALARLIWYPHIHSEIVAQAQSCRHCIGKGKNLKSIITKNNIGTLGKLTEPNEEIQMDFAGPIPFKNNTQNNYILVTVDRLSRFPHAETFNNCDTNTAIEYLESYCRLHGIPRSIRCDQAQAFKAKEFELFCKNRNIKLILAPAGDHRGTRMVERLIQTIKRRLAVLDIDPNWSTVTLANRVANIIENIRLIPNSTTKITPFKAHFGRKPNTEISNITTKPSKHNLTYKNITNACLDKKILSQNALTMEEIWRRDGNSEDELDIRYRDNEASSDPIETTQTTQPSTSAHSNQLVDINTESDNSENVPFARNKPSYTPSRKITPSEIHFTLGDKTTKYIRTRKNIARKSLARKTKEPRHTLAPQWNIIEDGTITGYSPHTITLDTPLRKNTVIRKNDLAIVTEKKTLPTQQIVENKPRLIHMVACKTVGEYKRNQEKIKKVCLEEAKQKKIQEQSASINVDNTKWTPEKIKKRQQKTKNDNNRLEGHQQHQKEKPSGEKKEVSRKRTRAPKKSPGEDFKLGSKQAALQSSSQFDVNRSFVKINAEPILQSENAEQITFDSNANQNFNIITSNDPSLFMLTSLDSPPIEPENIMIKETQAKYKSTPKIEKAMSKIKATKKDTPTVVFLDNQADNTTKNTPEQNKEIELIQLEQERIRLEQVNITTILPANTESNNQLEKDNRQLTQEYTSTHQDNAQSQSITEKQPPLQLDTTKRHDNIETEDKISPTSTIIPQSLKSSTTSQEYKHHRCHQSETIFQT